MSSDGSRAASIARLSTPNGEPGVTRPDAEIRLLTCDDAVAYRGR
jgi:hypothetical protein